MTLCCTCYRRGCNSRHLWPMRLWYRWRLKPGLLVASEEAERWAWGHRNAPELGPEQNMLSLKKWLRFMAFKEEVL